MNKKGQSIIIQSIVFLVLWLITGLIWSIWLDGIYVPIVSCITSLAVLGVLNIAIHFHR